MNRTHLLSISAFAMLVASSLLSCKEKVAPLDTGAVASDTAFIAPVETPKYRHVLIEEFTGVSCPPCPKGHVALEEILDKHYNLVDKYDSVSIIGIQSSGIPQTVPVDEAPYKSKHDNRTADGTELYSSVYGTFGSIPRAGIDRMLDAGSMAFARDVWGTTVDARLRTPALVNISLSSTYDAGSKQAIIKVHVAYTGDVAKKQNLNLALIENDIIDAQKNDTKIDSMYRHEHVLRDMLTIPTGSTMLNGISPIKAGQVYERTFVYDVNADWVPENCRLIAYVTNNEGTDKEVQQSAEISLK